MHTTETAPKGYSGPVRLTAAQKASTAAKANAFTASLIRTANDPDAHPEDRANAQAFLTNRGISY